MTYEVSVRKTMEIDHEEAADILAQILQVDFDFISKEINEMKNKGRWADHEIWDLNRNMEVRNAMNTLLSYYMTKRSYDEFMELQRVYGNVV